VLIPAASGRPPQSLAIVTVKKAAGSNNHVFKIGHINVDFGQVHVETAVSSAFLFKLNLCPQRSHGLGTPGLGRE
jgi:hypothetical protein